MCIRPTGARSPPVQRPRAEPPAGGPVPAGAPSTPHNVGSGSPEVPPPQNRKRSAAGVASNACVESPAPAESRVCGRGAPAESRVVGGSAALPMPRSFGPGCGWAHHSRFIWPPPPLPCYKRMLYEQVGRMFCDPACPVSQPHAEAVIVGGACPTAPAGPLPRWDQVQATEPVLHKVGWSGTFGLRTGAAAPVWGYCV